MKMILTCYCLLFYAISHAQPPPIAWDKSYGGSGYEELNAQLYTENNTMLLVGYTNSDDGDVQETPRGDGDVWVVKVNYTGDIIWEHRFGGAKLDRAWDAVVCANGDYLVVAETNSNVPSGDKNSVGYGGRDIWVLRIAQTGSLIWEKTFGGDQNDDVQAVVETSTGGFIVLGQSNSAAATGNKSAEQIGGVDFWAINIDADGNEIWQKTYGGTEEDQALAIVRNNTGGYLLGGGSISGALPGYKTQANMGSFDYWLVNIDINGNKIWDRVYGGNKEETVVCMSLARDGNFWVGGGSKSDSTGTKLTHNIGDADYWLIKVDNDGNQINEWTSGGDYLDKIYAIDENIAGYIMVGGISGTDTLAWKDAGRGSWDFWVIFLDPDLGMVWNKAFGGAGPEALTNVLSIPNDGLLLGGNSSSQPGFDKTADNIGLNDYWVFRLSCDFSIELGDDTTYCRGTEVTLAINDDDCQSCSIVWDDDYELGDDNREITVNQSYIFTATAISNSGCLSTDTIRLNYHPNADSAHIVIGSPVCYGDVTGVIKVVEAFGQNPPFAFSLPDFDLQDTLGQGFLNLEADDYLVRITDALGCVLDTLISLPEPPEFIVDLGDDITINLGDSYQLLPEINQPYSYFSWEPDTFNTLTPLVSPWFSETYTLKAINADDCVSYDKINVSVKRDGLYFAPNIFTPNDDGRNDYYTIYGKIGVVDIGNFQIFDRWGELVFNESTVWPTGLGWDGNFRGKQAPAGVYIWHGLMTLVDGTTQLIKGDVTIVR